MKFFIDTANLDQIKEAEAFGVLDGVTTNPSLMAKEGITGHDNILKHYVAICEAVEGDVSAEVLSTDLAGREIKLLSACRSYCMKTKFQISRTSGSSILTKLEAFRPPIRS